MLRPYIDHAPRAAFAASIALWVPATARTVGPVRPRKFSWASVRPMTTLPGWGRPRGGSGRGARRSTRQDDRQGREERVRVLHGGKCYTSPSMRDRVTRFADGAGAASRCRGPRSEEHTSELQSHHDLVCRLLLEKKKTKKKK